MGGGVHNVNVTVKIITSGSFQQVYQIGILSHESTGFLHQWSGGWAAGEGCALPFFKVLFGVMSLGNQESVSPGVLLLT